MVTLFGGLVGGLVATIVMTVFMMNLGDDSPPPTATLWARFVGSQGPEAYMMQGMVLHLIYGTVAGGVLAAAVLNLGVVSVATLGSAVLWGVVYAMVLAVGGMVFWMKVVLGMDADRQTMGLFVFFHLVYGVVLGGWLGYGILG